MSHLGTAPATSPDSRRRRCTPASTRAAPALAPRTSTTDPAAPSSPSPMTASRPCATQGTPSRPTPTQARMGTTAQAPPAQVAMRTGTASARCNGPQAPQPLAARCPFGHARQQQPLPPRAAWCTLLALWQPCLGARARAAGAPRTTCLCSRAVARTGQRRPRRCSSPCSSSRCCHHSGASAACGTCLTRWGGRALRTWRRMITRG